MRVEFANVGRGKKTWQAEISDDPLRAEYQLVREVMRSKALGSKGIDVTLDLETGEGAVYVGGFRKVGDVRVIESAHA